MGQLVTLTGVDQRAVAEALGDGTCRKGAEYVRRRAVLHMEWDEDDGVLFGLVKGSGSRVYTTSVFLDVDPDGDLSYHLGECSCPMEIDCKHAAALMLVAAGDVDDRVGATGATRGRSWEQSLTDLCGTGAEARDGADLAIQLTLVVGEAGAPRRPAAGGAGTMLLAQPMQQGRTGWISGGLTWSRLGSSPGYYGTHRGSHVRLLQQLYALHRAHVGPYGYTYGASDKTIDLAAFDSRQLWALLDEAVALGLPLVHADKRFGAVAPYARGQMCLDVTDDEATGGLVVTPVLHVDGTVTDATPVRFVGAEGHGVVAVPSTAGAPPFSLIRLDRPAPPGVARMAVAQQRLHVPRGERARFQDEFYPQLRHQAAIVSSDGSFTPPRISGPDLVLHASYSDGHDLDLTWAWAYRVGESPVRAALDAVGPGEGHRDPEAERRVLDALDLPLDRIGPRAESPQALLRPRVHLTGLDTMRFTTEVLPLLVESPRVIVEVSGEPADFREAGDAVAISVTTDEVAGETDWFDLGVSITVEGREIPFAPVFRALTQDETHLLLPDGAFFSLEKPELATLRRLIEEARALQDARDGPLRISRFQAGLWDELTEVGVVERQAAAWREQVAGLLALGSAPAPEPPASLQAELRPYQRDGFGWLTFLWQHRLGGILADDMGLGKTVQTLALICHAREADASLPPFLIVAPTSVVATWVSEAARFAPHLEVGAVHSRLAPGAEEVLAGADVVVTSYALFRLDHDVYSGVEWSGLVLDEAQHVKNHRAKAHQCARLLAAPFKLAITGTPMENNLMELWSLLAITAPGLFPSPTRFRDHFARPIEKHGDPERLVALRRRIRPLMRRRTKELVAADLPVKQEQVLAVELDPRHRTIYQRHLQRERQKILGLIDDLDRHRFTILRSLTLLRQLSLHAALIDDAHADVTSRKIEALVEQLTEVTAGGHRALVFSQFTGFLAHVRARLDAAGIAYEYLDGHTPRRAAVVQRFKEGAAPVFLISLKAGGFGLNLTEADYCFVLDPWWNPATEAQAVDRAHRIGQTRPVNVYRLIATGTIEEKVMALKAAKAELFAGVMDSGDAFSSKLGAEDIRALVG